MQVFTKQPWGNHGATLARVLLQLCVHLSRRIIILLSTVSNIREAVALPASKVTVEKLTADTKAAVVIVLLSALFTPPAIPVMVTSALNSLEFFFCHILRIFFYAKHFVKRIAKNIKHYFD